MASPAIRGEAEDVENATGAPQTVLVLGGTSEIGLATARALADRGAQRFLLAGRRPDALASAAASLRETGAAVETFTYDARDTEGHAAFAEAVTSRGWDVDLVLFAFGALGDQAEAEADPSHALEVLETNYVGAVSTALALLPRLHRQGHGTFVFLSSVAGERVRRANFVYGSSKAGVDGFAQGLGDAVQGTGLRVLVVRPGFVKTKMTAHLDPAPLSTTPEAVAAAIVRGLEKGAEIIWAPPLLRWVMVVLRHLPRAVFRRLPV